MKVLVKKITNIKKTELIAVFIKLKLKSKKFVKTLNKSDITIVIAFLALGVSILSYSSTKNSNIVNAKYRTKNIDCQLRQAEGIERLISIIEPLSREKLEIANVTNIPIPLKKPSSPALNKQGKVMAACIMLAAQTYSVPPAILVGLYKLESGLIGEQYGPLKDGTYGLGPMKINSSKLSILAKEWNTSEAEAKKWLKDDPCTNMGVAAWQFRKYLDISGSIAEAITLYGSDDPNYKQKIIRILQENGLIK